jgi:hypothetical protein
VALTVLRDASDVRRDGLARDADHARPADFVRA